MDSGTEDASPSEWRGQFGGEPEPSARVISAAPEWERLWRETLRGEPPPVDFGRHRAVAVFAGSRSTGGFSVEFLEPEVDGGEAVVRYRIRGPGPGQFVVQAFTRPYAIRLYRRTELRLSVAEER